MTAEHASRRRGEALREAVFAAALEEISLVGVRGASMDSIAQRAGTGKAALYRRWPTKADLAAAVVAQLADDRQGDGSADPLGDLVRELADFQRGVSRPGRLSLVGTMLQDTTDPDVRARYRESVIAPRVILSTASTRTAPV